MNQLLKLRYFQYKRDLGIWFCLIMAAVSGITWLLTENSEKNAVLIISVNWFLLLQHFQNRKDLNFISKYLEGGYFQISFNYNLLILPVSIPLIIHQHYLIAAMLHLFACMIIFFRRNILNLELRFISKFIPPGQFEWISGLRKYFLFLALLVPFAILLSPVKLFALIPLALINVILLDFYSVFEPRFMLNPENLSAEEFLNRKLAFTCKVLFFTDVPFLMVNSFFHPDGSWFNLVFLLIFICAAANGICIKYSQYEPAGQLRISADYILLFASFLIPYLVPVCILLFFYNYRKAKNNLSEYFL